ncbi:hypothetical protein V6N12_007748 [Hibiscus sabdariffa]|uniref:Uncharacterized protein n=1 Tax=Hibiscus sabdariffa TaxID=183260 RepID=A0ABR2F2N4_9ROSI
MRGEKSIEHLVLSCKFSWQLWMRWCSIWEVQVAFPLEGIERILKTHKGDVLIEFFKSIGSSDVASTELLAILEALSIVVNQNGPRPTVDSYLRLGANLNWQLKTVGRDCHQTADSLIKSGINRQLDYLFVAE